MPKLISLYPDIKKYASDYLSQINYLVKDLYKLKDNLTEALFYIETEACHCRSLLDKGDTPLAMFKGALKELPPRYNNKFSFLEEFSFYLPNHIKLLNESYKAYSDAEVLHG
ncbi:hypothetical protein [Rickettsiella endosymbiont of Miltochrista miniata]|uniref:hypothetical protein n=1 Tax=Rickettsiella endosymbiont of Miltochrista miniata TaxID=3066239 RepID=UPI00313D8860